MKKEKLLKLITVFFVLFVLSGIGSIIDYYLEIFPHMFTKLGNLYDLIRLGHFSVKVPYVPIILLILTIAVFVFVIRRFYKLITAEIKKAHQ